MRALDTERGQMQPPETARTELLDDLPPGLTVERVEDPARLREIEDLQFQVWGGDPREVVPTHMLYIVEKSGGVLLAAYDRGRLAGFVLGLLGRSDGKLYHASHMLGIYPDYQGKGIGATLKRAQRAAALEQGLTLMTWTYDPLESRNAHFNIHKLGATSRTYHDNLYGVMEDDLNRGMASDRLTVEWQLDRPARHTGMTEDPAPLLLNQDERPLLRPVPSSIGAPLTVAIPGSIQYIKSTDLDAALAWRLAVREALTWAFTHHYRIIDFSNGAYLLAHDTDHQITAGAAATRAERDHHAH
jgi:predicted GNAT superfamily acetyltransferase